MKTHHIPHEAPLDTLPRMPVWVTSTQAETLEDVAFLSGAALAHLHLVWGREEVPQSVVRERLALKACEACMVFAGRPERAGALRDALHFLRPGDLPGPAGETYHRWRCAVERPATLKSLHRALPEFDPDQIATWLDGHGAGQGGPIARAATVLETIMTDVPRAEGAGDQKYKICTV